MMVIDDFHKIKNKLNRELKVKYPYSNEFEELYGLNKRTKGKFLVSCNNETCNPEKLENCREKNSGIWFEYHKPGDLVSSGCRQPKKLIDFFSIRKLILNPEKIIDFQNAWMEQIEQWKRCISLHKNIRYDEGICICYPCRNRVDLKQLNNDWETLKNTLCEIYKYLKTLNMNIEDKTERYRQDEINILKTKMQKYDDDSSRLYKLWEETCFEQSDLDIMKDCSRKYECIACKYEPMCGTNLDDYRKRNNMNYTRVVPCQAIRKCENDAPLLTQLTWKLAGEFISKEKNIIIVGDSDNITGKYYGIYIKDISSDPRPNNEGYHKIKRICIHENFHAFGYGKPPHDLVKYSRSIRHLEEGLADWTSKEVLWMKTGHKLWMRSSLENDIYDFYLVLNSFDTDFIRWLFDIWKGHGDRSYSVSTYKVFLDITRKLLRRKVAKNLSENLIQSDDSVPELVGAEEAMKAVWNLKLDVILVPEKAQVYDINNPINELKYNSNPHKKKYKTNSKPIEMRLKNEVYKIEYVYEILVNTANWLIDQCKVINYPIAAGNRINNNRYLINKESVHKDGKPFTAPKILNNNYILETHYSRKDTIENAERLLEKLGYPKNTLYIKYGNKEK